jgi:hypothetical protein
MTFLICSGLLYPNGWAAQPLEPHQNNIYVPTANISRRYFSRAEKPSEDIKQRLFFFR